MPIKGKKVTSEKMYHRKLQAEMFTDRENPQEAFERKIHVFEENWDSVTDGYEVYGVLCYYGIGGVGKSALKNKLMRLIDKKEDPILKDKPVDAYYAQFDFENQPYADKKDILVGLRNGFVAKYPEFSFPFFDMAIRSLERQMGEANSLVEREQSSITDNSAVTALGIGANIIDILISGSPIGNIAEMAVGIADLVFKTIPEIKNRKRESLEEEYKKEVDYIKEMISDKSSTEDINEILHELFAFDMRVNAKYFANKNKPIVYFLDAYEKYVDSFYHEDIIIDSWLRKDSECLIKKTPGLWVVMSREKLNWRKDDGEAWDPEPADLPLEGLSAEQKNELAENNLEQHLLGDLSPKDTISYFQAADINDTELCNELYRLTQGTPVYMKICLDTYRNYINNGKTNITIKEFGKNLNELVKRYLENMPDSYRDFTYVAAIIKNWDDTKFKEVFSNMDRNNRFDEDRYNYFIEHSFVLEDQNGKYHLHDAVRLACLDKNPSIFKDIREALFEYGKNNNQLGDIIESVLYEGVNPQAFRNGFVYIKKNLDIYHNKGLYETEQYYLLDIYNRLKDYLPDTGYVFYIKQRFASLLALNGQKEIALEYIDEDAIGKVYADIDFLDYCNAIIYQANVYYKNNLIDEGAELSEQIKEQLAEKEEQESSMVEEVESTGDNYQEFERVKLKVELQIGEGHYYKGFYEKSLEIDEMVFEECKEKLGPDHPDTLRSMNAISACYAHLERLSEAIELQEVIIEKARHILGENHPSTLLYKSNLAVDYRELRQYNEALKVDQEVYEKRKATLGEDHVDSIRSLLRIAIDYRELNKYDEALKVDQEVYEKRKAVLGVDHVDTLNSLERIAADYHESGRYNEALKVNQEVYEKRKTMFGEAHKDTLDSLHRIAVGYYCLKQYDEAIKIHEEIYEKRKSVLGEDNEYTISSLKRIAADYRGLKQYDEAIKVEQKIYEKRKAALGETHEDTLKSLQRIAANYRSLNRYDEALKLDQEVYEKQKVALGEGHPDTLKTENDLAIYYSLLGQYDKALKVDQEVYEKRKAILGENHVDTLRSLQRIAMDYRDLNQYDEALKIDQEVYEKMKEVFGENHIETQKSLKRILLEKFFLEKYVGKQKKP